MMGQANIPHSVQAELSAFAVDVEAVALRFRQAMEDGLAGRESPLKMLPAFIAKPSGEEKGIYLVLDFGGSNIRLMLAELKGAGQYRIIDRRSWPLQAPNGSYDYTSGQASAVGLFDFIAKRAAEMIAPDTHYLLGHTFSFPCRQLGVNQAILLTWTKEIRTAGVEGREVTCLLKEALRHNGLEHNIIPAAIINDTVGTLLAAAYRDAHADIGAICGTGHNACYLEPRSPLTGGPMIINMESGGFDRLTVTRYDRLLDAASEKPGAQIMEKMMAGKYLGELARLIIRDLARFQALPRPIGDSLSGAYCLSAEDLGIFLADRSEALQAVDDWLTGKLGFGKSALADRELMQKTAELVMRRSARLAAGAFLGVLKHIDPCLEGRHVIAVDGSVYEKMPGYAAMIQQALTEALKGQSGRVGLTLSKDGSGIGAAIAAAVAGREHY